MLQAYSYRWTGICAIAFLFGFFVELHGQEPASLDYLSPMTTSLVIVRPSMLKQKGFLTTAVARDDEFTIKFVRHFEKFFAKFTDIRLADMDQVHIASQADFFDNQSASHTVLIRLANNSKFDLAKINGETTNKHDYKGVTYFELKRPVDETYRYLCQISDDTILWGSTDRSIETTLSLNVKKDPVAQTVKAARKSRMQFLAPHLSKPFFVYATGEGISENPLTFTLHEAMAIYGSVDIDPSFTIRLMAICENETKAQTLKNKINFQLKQVQKWLKENELDNEQETKWAEQALKAINVNQPDDALETVEFLTNVSPDERFSSVVFSFVEAHHAKKQFSRAMSNVRSLTLAIHHYRKPIPSILVSKEGKKYSWRIALLPYLDEQAIYDQYRFDEDWNSPHNTQVTSRMPNVFRSNTDNQDSIFTAWFMLSGPDGLTDGEKALKRSDSSAFTFALVEDKRKTHWAKPEDIQIDPEKGFPQLSGYHPGGFFYTTMDGSGGFISEKISPDVLWKFYTARGGEPLKSKMLYRSNE